MDRDVRSPLRRLAPTLVLLLCALVLVWLVWGRGGQDDVKSVPARPPAVRGDGPTLAVPPPAPTPVPVPAPAPPAEPTPKEPDPAPRVIEFVVRELGSKAPVGGVRLTATWSYYVQPKAPEGGQRAIVNVLQETRVDATVELDVGGVGRVEAPRKLDQGPSSVSLGPTWHVFRIQREGREPGEPLALDADVPTRIEVWAQRAYRLVGHVVDAQGAPLEHVNARYGVWASEVDIFFAGGGATRTDAQGRFDAGPFLEDPQAALEGAHPWTSEQMRHVIFILDGYAPLRLATASIPVSERGNVRVVMTRGVTLAGTLKDASGKPLADVPVVVEYGHAYELRRGVRTDAEGRWRLERLTPGEARLVARAFAYDAKVARDLVLTEDDLDVRLVALDIRLSRPPMTTQVLGLALCEVDDELRAAYDVPAEVKVLMFDVGPEASRLGIGRLERGYGLWMVGEKPVTSLRDAIERLLAEASTANDSRPGSKRVVYTFWNEQMSGTNTQYATLGPAQRDELRALLDRLPR